VSSQDVQPGPEKVFQGIGVSPGVAVGEVALFALNGSVVPVYEISETQIPLEISRFEDALTKTRHQITEMQKKVCSMAGEEPAGIFDAHLLVVDDRCFIEQVFRVLREKRLNVERVVEEVSLKYTDMLGSIEDDYLRERSADVHDVTRRIIKNLIGESGERMEEVQRPCIAVAHDFTPSDTAGMNPEVVHGLVSDQGSSTSHAAIMARALEVPAVVGLHNVVGKLSSGDTLLVDGIKGLVILHPTPERLAEYAKWSDQHKQLMCALDEVKQKPSRTTDGHPVPIAANIELPKEAERVAPSGAKGVGLFRTEFLFLKNQLPTEDEQFEVYAEVADRCAPETVVIRTLDLGGDKVPPFFNAEPEANPFLGLRAIRFCLAHPDFFKKQLRAVLRAAHGRNIALMYPMVCSVEEVVMANKLLEECRRELVQEGKECAEDLSVGVMIEIPSAALIAEQLAPHVSFFSLGTNDLTQYTLAVDRGNDQVAHLYQQTHISVLRLINHVARVGKDHNVPVTVCGEMAADPILVPLLVGLGISHLSLGPSSVPLVKDVVRKLHFDDCKELAKKALRVGSADDVISLCRKILEKRAPEILELIG
jgi:phosphotransferase system enzyme I (PtsI)